MEAHTIEALPEDVASSEQVFVARISNHVLLQRLDGGPYLFSQVDYVLVESLKGEPAGTGVLVERTGIPAVEGAVPGPSCGPWIAMPQNDGQTVLVFASRVGSPEQLVPSHRSMLLRPGTPDSERWLDTIRSIQRQRTTP